MTEPTGNVSSEITIEKLVDQFVEQLRAGQNPTVSEYKQKHPQLAGEIDELFPMLLDLEDRHETSTGKSSRLEIEIPERLGEYIIIRELGRGGMGVVYEAMHETMQRRVALKVLPKAFTERSQFLERFMREARSAGQLHHTNIVPVFEVGNVDGYYFYAMQYIHGQNLDMVIDELRRFNRVDRNETEPQLETWPQEQLSDVSATASLSMLKGFAKKKNLNAESGSNASNRSDKFRLSDSNLSKVNPSSEWSQVGESKDTYFHRVALVGMQVADALEFAHEHGVLHRDIKPGNLILDTAGVVWVTDFGLAKNDGDNLTHTGDVVGTLRYMAPERFDGKVDRRSDVYSLGLTLYELCTLEFAFGESDRAKLIKKVMSQSPVAPRHLRPEIPRDLETVIVKATARDAKDRYQTAAELKADLGRFHAGSPVKARRVSFSERIWRWSKRHPSRAALVVSLMLLLTTLAIGSMFVAYRENKYANDLEIENFRARKAEKDARRSEKQARDSEKKALRSNLASQAHLFWAHYNSGVSRRTTNTPGQYFDVIDSLSRAYSTLPKLKLRKGSEKRRQLAVRAQAIAAMTNFDLKKEASWKIKDSMSQVFAIDFRNNQLAQSAKNGDIEIREIESQNQIGWLKGPATMAWNLQFSPDGKYLASGHPTRSRQKMDQVVIWDLKTRKPVFKISEGLANRPLFDFSPDGKQLAVVMKNGFAVFRTSDGFRLKDHDLKQQPSLIKFAEKSQLLLITDKRKVIHRWSLAKNESLTTYESNEPMYSLDVDPGNGRIVVGSNRIVMTWPMGNLENEPVSFIAHGNRVTNLKISPDGKYLISSGWDNKTRVFQFLGNRLILSIHAHYVNPGNFSQDGSRIGFIQRNQSIGVWKIYNESPHRVLSVPLIEQTQKARFHPTQSKILVALATDEIQFWNHGKDRLLKSIRCNKVSDFGFTQDGKRLFACCEDGLKSWNIGCTESQIDIGEETVVSKTRAKYLHVDQQNNAVVLRLDGGDAMLVRLRAEADQKSELKIGPHQRMDHARITPCGKYLVTSTWKGRDIKVWDATSGQLIKGLAPDWKTATFAFSPDGKQLVATCEKGQKIWEIGSWDLKRETPRDKLDGFVGDTAWSKNGDWIISAYTMYQPQLVSAESGEILAVFEPTVSVAGNMMRISDDNRFLVVASRDQVHVWDIELIQQNLKKLGMQW